MMCQVFQILKKKKKVFGCNDMHVQ